MSQEENNATEEVVEAPVDAPAESEASTEQPEETPAEGAQVMSDGTVAPPAAYTPNLKYKVMDQEHSFDPWLADVIKDEEREKRIRELYEKSTGLDYVKPKYEKLKEDHQKLNGTWQQVVSDMGKLGGFLQNKDYGSAFQSLGLTDQQIMQYAVERLNYYELPPEQRQKMDEQSRRNQQLVAVMQENESFKRAQADFEGQQLVNEVQGALQKLGVSDAVNAIDERAGYTGAFYEHLKNHALRMFERTQRDPSPEEAISSFLRLYGIEAGQRQSPSQVGGARDAQQAPGTRPNTIPSLKGSGVSPVKPVVSSIEDLKNLRDKKYGR